MVNGSLDVSEGRIRSSLFRELSDVNLKTNVEDLTNALESVLSLQGYSYKWRKGCLNSQSKIIGFIAQEISIVLPQVSEILSMISIQFELNSF